MSEIEVITDGGRRRRWSASEKLRIVEETMFEGESISAFVRRNGVAPNLLYRWRKLMLEGGSIAVAADESVAGNKIVRDMEARIRELDRQLERKTMEMEILREAPDNSRAKKTDLACAVVETGRFAMKTVADVLDVSRSNLHDRVNGSAKPRQGYHKGQDAALLPRIQALVAKRTTYGYRRITAILNRHLRSEGLAVVNHKRVYQIMERNNLFLQRCGFGRPERNHGGKVVMMRSNLRWCSDGLEFACRNGDVIRLAFLIDAHDREIISWRAVANAGISGSDVRDMLLEAVESRFGTPRVPEQVEVLSDSGSSYRAKDTSIFAQQLGPESCFTPVKSPQSNGMSEAFVKTLKRDDVRVNPLPKAKIVLSLIGDWIEDYNENHPHSGLKMEITSRVHQSQNRNRLDVG